MNGSRKCDIYTQCGFTQPKGIMTWLESKWMQLEDIMLSEVSQVWKHKGKGCIFSFIGGR
jgi:hypothetical protein